MYFLAVFAGLMTLLFFFFPDTWRRERSRVYQKAISDALKRSLKAEAAAEKKRARKRAKGLASTATTPAETRRGTPSASGAMTPATRPGSVHDLDVERGEEEEERPRRLLGLRRRLPSWMPFAIGEAHEISPSFRDVNPIPTMISIFRSPTNAGVLISSGLLFAAQYTTTYTASLTFARAPYNYNPLIIGVVLLGFGVGSILGSVIGGRMSDWIQRRLSEKNGGVVVPEVSRGGAEIGGPHRLFNRATTDLTYSYPDAPEEHAPRDAAHNRGIPDLRVDHRL